MSQNLDEVWRGFKSRLLHLQCKVSKSVMIWETIPSSAVDPDILEHVMFPSADKCYGEADFIFQQNSAPAHTAKNDLLYLAMVSLSLSGPYSGLAYIPQRICVILSKGRQETPDPTIQRMWGSSTPQQWHRLVTSMLHCINAVIHTKGAPIKYWLYIMYRTWSFFCVWTDITYQKYFLVAVKSNFPRIWILDLLYKEFRHLPYFDLI